MRLDKRRLVPEDRGRIVRRLPGELLRQLRRVRLHRRSRGAARPHLQQRNRLARPAARFLARFHRRGRRDQGSAHRPGDRRARRAAGAAPVPAARRRQRSAPVPDLRRGRLSLKLCKFGAFIGCSNYPECRYTRQLSAPAMARADIGTKKLGEDPDDRPRSDAAQRPFRALCAARRGGRRREAEARRPAQGRAPEDVDLDAGARAAVAAARGRQASRGRRADPRRHRPLRPLCAARQDLRQSRSRRRRAHHRPQPGGDADRREDRQGSAQPPLRRRPGPPARRASEQRRTDRGQERPLRALCQP